MRTESFIYFHFPLEIVGGESLVLIRDKEEGRG